MPKVTIIQPGIYEYKCLCGREIIYEHDIKEKPKRLVRCFECQQKFKENKHV